MLKLLIADASDEYPSAIAEQVGEDYDLRICREGHEAMELLRTFRPDLMVLDMMLPGIDGITLLQMAHEENIWPVVLAMTTFSSEYVVRSLETLGVGYVLRRPCDLRAAVLRLSDLAEHFKSANASQEELIAQTLVSLGMPMKLQGFRYLQQSVLIFAENPGQLITKEVYPKVAKKNDASTSQVERSIRNAISAAWENRDEARWRDFFPPDKDGNLSKPTNGAFLAALAAHVNSQLHR